MPLADVKECEFTPSGGATIPLMGQLLAWRDQVRANAAIHQFLKVRGARVEDMGGNPKNAGIGYNFGRLPTVKEREEPSHPSRILSVSMTYGASMIYTALCVQIVTDA